MTDPRAYARAFVAEWRWYRGTREVPTSERDREMLAAALDDLLAEAEFIDAVKALP